MKGYSVTLEGVRRVEVARGGIEVARGLGEAVEKSARQSTVSVLSE